MRIFKTGLFVSRWRGLFTRNLFVLGIETSCDDTGIAIVNSHGDVHANALNSQQKTHSRYGGIIPPRAQELHRENISGVFEQCMQSARMQPEQLDAIAVTTRPGLPMSLMIGIRFARHLARRYNKPLVPIHHMEAHALQARMEHRIPYPFLCLLISGGHCLLSIVRGPREFQLLGFSLDDAPGEAFDKIARRLRLYLIPKYRSWSGGQAIEDAASQAEGSHKFEFPLLMAHKRDCNFSFAGLKNNSVRIITTEERKLGVPIENSVYSKFFYNDGEYLYTGLPPDCIIPSYKDFCAAVLKASSRHLMNRTQRALEYCLLRNVFVGSEQRSLVVSGGVANNDYIFTDIRHLAQEFDCQTFRPSKKYCCDNGVMIAWNGIERILDDENSMRWDYDEVEIKGKAQLGKSLVDDVQEANLKCKWIKAEKKNV